MADVLLTHSYHLYYDGKQVKKMRPYAPLATLYAAALLREQGISVAVFDSMLQNPEEGFPAALALHKPRIVAVYEDSFNFLSKMCLTRMREVAYAMAAAACKAGVITVAHGSDATDHTADYLKNGFRYVLVGEAEWVLLELVTAILTEQANAGDTPGVTSLKSGSAVTGMAARKPMKNLDRLPFPARDLISLEPYRQQWKAVHGAFSMNIVSSRGCPYSCNWCAKPIYGNSFHARSPENVAMEMQELKEIHGAEHLWFADDIFALNRHWARAFAGEVKQRDCALPFKMQSRADLMTREVAADLRKAGCAEVWMGVESGSQKVLDAMGKGIRIDEIIAARENLARSGIRACFFLQFGYPGETWDDILLTLDLLRTTRPDDVGVSVAYPLPGTPFYERVRQQLGQKTNWMDSSDLAMMFRGAYSGEFYHALHDLVHAEVTQWAAPRDCDEPVGIPLRELWRQVTEMEVASRNPHPTILEDVAVGGGFVQIEHTSNRVNRNAS